jgi:L-ribulose-5-phosphate 3-epimerase
MRLCLFSTVFRETTLDVCAKAIAEIGYGAIEIRTVSHLPPDSTAADRSAVSALLKETGLALAGLYTPYGRYASLPGNEKRQEQLDLVKRYVEWAAELGAGHVNQFPGGPAPVDATEADYAVAAEWVGRAADVAAEAGIPLVMEMHHGGLIETIESSLKLLRMIDRPNVGLTYDPSNMAIARADYGETAIASLLPYIRHVHVKDIRFPAPGEEGTHFGTYRGLPFCHALLGEGSVDHLPLLATLYRLGYRGDLSCECHLSGDPVAIALHEYGEVRRLVSSIQQAN